ncbi:hypothetical protein RchiOBHm_Chr7g0210521 [Rosa chinensis]|uniref:Uncharacterized protein n=1 Tax=Rosa chinensis TaxID=74649 RepID=A0A2P6PA86_ROSCH|nr:hypothetical protein RchiOBHm_Chr7g0210521 [Rosa chinensis]
MYAADNLSKHMRRLQILKPADTSLYECCGIYTAVMFLFIFFFNLVGEVLEVSVKEKEVIIQ